MTQKGTFQNLANLQILYLSQNQITMIQRGTFQNLANLQKLYLSQNQITMIKTGTFQNMPNLQKLNLDYYCITNITPNAFKNLPKLQCLDLQSNQMSVIPPSAFYLLPSLRTIQLAHNPWRCDCKMAPFRLNVTKLSIIKQHQIICAQPDKFWGKRLTDVCDEPTVSPLTERNAIPLAYPVTLPLVHPLESANEGCNVTVTSRYHWFFTRNVGSTARPAGNGSRATPTLTPPLVITSDKPESDPSSSALFNFGAVSSTVSSFAMIGGTICLIVWCKKRIRHPPLGLNPGIVVGGNTNTAISVMANVHDNQQEDINSNCDQTGQSRSQPSNESETNTTAAVLASGDDQTGQAQSPTVANLSRNKVLAALKPNPMYPDVETTPKSAGIASSHDQAGQGQSNAITESNTHTYTVMASCHDQTEQDQPHVITESNTHTTCAAVASGNDLYYEDVDNHRVKTGQGQYQAITESLAARSLSYGIGSTASELNALYKSVEQLK
ncbi:uncharacterized protein LOC144921194 [Branchiostoma floridae x Branchiostoma belcheri]